jgi:hypothetical protein
MLGALGGVTVVASVLSFQRYPRFVLLAWIVYVLVAVAVSFEVPI